MAARAVSLASGATASSRSKISPSAGKARAFSRARGFEPGMNRTLRRGRIGADIARFLLGFRLLADIIRRRRIGRCPAYSRLSWPRLAPTPTLPCKRGREREARRSSVPRLQGRVLAGASAWAPSPASGGGLGWGLAGGTRRRGSVERRLQRV